MYLFWLIIALGVFFLILACIQRRDKVGEEILSCSLILILGLSWAAPLALGLVLTPNLEYVRVETTKRTTELLCIKDNFKLSGGSMFVGISQDMYYYYYTQDPDGAIALNKIPVRAVKLYEDAPTGTGYFVERWSIVSEPSKPSKSKWVFNIRIQYKPRDRIEQREIHVPLGTVLRHFVLDAE